MSYTSLRFQAAPTRHSKILCLIIASESSEYDQMAQQWRTHIAKVRKAGLSIQFYFLRCSNTVSCPTLDTSTDTFTIPGDESLIPGIFNKTMQALLETIDLDYDYLLRTNLSSFFKFQTLIQYLNTQPSDNYTGTFLEISNEQLEMTLKGGFQIKIRVPFLNGAAFIMSKNVVSKMVKIYTCMTPTELSYIITLPDDVAISMLVAGFYDWSNMRVLPRVESNTQITLYDIPPDWFHVRLKTGKENERGRDIANMTRLVEQIVY